MVRIRQNLELTTQRSLRHRDGVGRTAAVLLAAVLLFCVGRTLSDGLNPSGGPTSTGPVNHQGSPSTGQGSPSVIAPLDQLRSRFEAGEFGGTAPPFHFPTAGSVTAKVEPVKTEPVERPTSNMPVPMNNETQLGAIVDQSRVAPHTIQNPFLANSSESSELEKAETTTKITSPTTMSTTTVTSSSSLPELPTRTTDPPTATEASAIPSMTSSIDALRDLVENQEFVSQRNNPFAGMNLPQPVSTSQTNSAEGANTPAAEGAPRIYDLPPSEGSVSDSVSDTGVTNTSPVTATSQPKLLTSSRPNKKVSTASPKPPAWPPSSTGASGPGTSVSSNNSDLAPSLPDTVEPDHFTNAQHPPHVETRFSLWLESASYRPELLIDYGPETIIPAQALNAPLILAPPRDDVRPGEPRELRMAGPGDRFAQVTDATSSRDGAGNSSASGGSDDEEQKLGEAPEETNTELQFLRRQSILLDTGEHQFDVTFQYLLDESDVVIARLNNGLLEIGEVRRRQRLMLLPIEFRYGLTPVTQVFVNVPFGWANSETIFLSQDTFENTGGIGDVSAGFTRQLIEGNEHFPDVLFTFAFSAPTGDSRLATSLLTPGVALGQGFWTVSAGLSMIQVYDPVVFFYGFGYRHRFQNTFDNGVRVNPGKQIFYQFGAGFAVNESVTLSSTLAGSYITDDYINGVRLPGSVLEPLNLRIAATVTKGKPAKGNRSVRTIEPFVNFGLSEEAIDATIGISCTR